MADWNAFGNHISMGFWNRERCEVYCFVARNQCIDANEFVIWCMYALSMQCTKHMYDQTCDMYKVCLCVCRQSSIGKHNRTIDGF